MADMQASVLIVGGAGAGLTASMALSPSHVLANGICETGCCGAS